MMYRNNNGNWNDASCNAKLASICEIGAAARALCQGKQLIKEVSTSNIHTMQMKKNIYFKVPPVIFSYNYVYRTFHGCDLH